MLKKMSMVDAVLNFVAELAETQLTGHKSVVLAGEFSGITDNVTRVTNHLN